MTNFTLAAASRIPPIGKILFLQKCQQLTEWRNYCCLQKYLMTKFGQISTKKDAEMNSSELYWPRDKFCFSLLLSCFKNIFCNMKKQQLEVFCRNQSLQRYLAGRYPISAVTLSLCRWEWCFLWRLSLPYLFVPWRALWSDLSLQ